MMMASFILVLCCLFLSLSLSLSCLVLSLSCRVLSLSCLSGLALTKVRYRISCRGFTVHSRLF
jgi:hypothetical protein